MPAAETPPATRAEHLRALGFGALLVAAVVVVYWGTLAHGFIWDDDLHVTANPRIIGPEGLREIWTTAAANYFPLVLTNFWVQHALWGLNPLGYHAITIGCHALCALLLWRVLLALRVPGAWLGAALWALHPVQVESVAWISELKNTQSGLFFLLAIWFWVKWLDSARSRELQRVEALPVLRPLTGARGYVLALFCALLALLSKPSTVMLPVVLALCTWWQRGDLRLRELARLVPFFALSAVVSGWTIWEQRVHSGAVGAEWSHGLLERCAIAGKTAWFYLGKLVWPHPLSFIYPRWATTARPLDLLPATVALAGLGALWWRRAQLRPLFLAVAFFVALLFPVLGFFDVYFFRYSFVGDHFQYLASMGPLALVGAGLAQAWPRLRPVLAAAVLLTATGLTVQQARDYRDRETLWRATLARNPGALMAWLNLAATLADEGRHGESIATFQHALTLAPDNAVAHSDLGCELLFAGRSADALRHLEQAIRLTPNRPEPHNNLGNVLRTVGRSDEAITHYRRAIELDPNYADAHNNLGAELAERGRPAEALPHFSAALRLKPKNADAHNNLAIALRMLGRFDDALARHETALRLKPDLAEAEAGLGQTLVAAGRGAEALPHLQRALQLKPDLARAHEALGTALAADHREDEAFAQFERAVQLAPNSPVMRNNFGTALARAGRTAEAIAQFEGALRVAPDFAPALVNLGMALCASGRWSGAVGYFERALKFQPDSAEAHARLAVALVNADRLEESVPIFQAALRLDPASAGLHDQFGQVLAKLGRNREALEQLEEAARLRRR